MAKETIAGTLRLIRALIDGEKLDRNSAAKIMNVNPEAAYRRLGETAQALGCIEESTENATKVFRMDLLRASPTTFEERIAAAFASALAKIFPEPKLQAAFNAVRSKLSSGRHELDVHMDRKFFLATRVGEVALPESSKLLAKLLRAVVEQREVRIDYEDFDGNVKSAGGLKPLSLFIHEHQLYLLAEHPQKGFRNYRFARIDDVQVSERHFEYPEATRYDPATIFLNSFGIFMPSGAPIEHVVVQVDKRWSNYAEKHRWHGTQRVEHAHGCVNLHLDVRICPELEQWILGFGEEAVVLQPESLRSRIRDRSTAAVQRYVENAKPSRQDLPSPRHVEKGRG